MKTIPMIEPEYLKAVLNEVKEKIAELNKSKKLSMKDRLFREHLITLDDNPNPANVILFMSGRPEEMQRR